MQVHLILAKKTDAQRIHDMKYRAFLPIYEIYQDKDTSPAAESIDKTIRILNSDYNWYLSYPNG